MWALILKPDSMGADIMRSDERAQLLEWYEKQNDQVFCNN